MDAFLFVEKMRFLLLVAIFSTLASAAPTTPPPGDDGHAALLQGVAVIHAPGAPGGVCVFGPQAFAVVAGREGKTAMLPVAAAGRCEKGRVFAFGHNGFLTDFADSGTGALLVNAVHWAAPMKEKPRVATINNAGLATHLKTHGFDATESGGKGWSRKLTGVDVVCVDAHRLAAEDVETLVKFIRSGGGLITAATGWGWLQGKERSQLATEFPGSRVIREAGLIFTAGTPGKTTSDGYSTGGDLALLNAGAALEAVVAHSMKKSALTAPQLSQCGATLSDALRALPPDDKLFLPRLAALTTTPGTTDFPRADKPLNASDPLARLMFTRTLEALRDAPPEQIKAHPVAEFFPGAVAKTAARIASRAVAIDTSVPAWHSTGLYAAPGELIRVQFPPEAAGKGFGVRIGCHTDALWHLDRWQRSPEISRREPVKQALTTAANAFGGLIYIDVPESAGGGKISVTISGAVEAPRFVLGQTSLLDWKNKIRNAPAPLAELETSKIILSVPSEKIRLLDDPEALMKFWDQVLDAEADLATIPRERKRPERIVPDVQISAGYMHSGYPIMTFLDKSVEHSLSLAEMKQGSWGHFHELGHNHQQSDWTFAGTTEVTCNLFSLYCMETLCGKPPGQGHDAMEPTKVDKRLRDYLAASDKFSRWKADPFLALTMYHQLRMGFGWETYKKVFAEYRAMPKTERPKSDDEKRDQWMTRFSKAAGKNLGPFFEAWGVPTSNAARDSIKELPAWMPDDWPK